MGGYGEKKNYTENLSSETTLSDVSQSVRVKRIGV